MTRQRHDHSAIALHWLVALAVAAAYGLALWREEVPRGDFRNLLTGLHMSAGVLVLGLSVVRIGLRPFAASVPPPPGSLLMHRLAKLGHLTLHIAALAVPIIGVLMVWAKGRSVGFFGLSIPAPVTLDRAFAAPLEEAHEIAANLMMIMAGLHAAAALGHHYLLKDGTLSRMIPFGRTARG